MIDPEVDKVLARAKAAELDGDYGAAVAYYRQAAEAGHPEAAMQLEGVFESLRFLLWRRRVASIAEDAASVRTCDEELMHSLDQGVGGSFLSLFDELATVQSESPDLVPDRWSALGALAVELERGGGAYGVFEALPFDTSGARTYPESVTEWMLANEGITEQAVALFERLDALQRDAVERYFAEYRDMWDAWD